MCACVNKGKNGYTKSWHMWKVCIHLGECICSGGVAFKIIFYHFSSCVEPLSLLEGLALFLEVLSCFGLLLVVLSHFPSLHGN